MNKVILITNDQEVSNKIKKIALQLKCHFASYTEEEWATFDDLEDYIQDEEIAKHIIALPKGDRSVHSLNTIESEAIKQVIHKVGGNAVKAAKVLNIGRATLYRKLRKHRLSLDQARKDKYRYKPKKLYVVKKAA